MVCATLWCNSVAKHGLRWRRSTPASTALPTDSRMQWESQTCSSTQKPNDKDALKTTRRCAVPSCGNCLCIVIFLIPTLGKSGWTWFLMKFQTVSKNLVLCSLTFTTDSCTNKVQFDVGFSERLKLKDDAVPTMLNPTVMSHHLWSLCGHYCFVCYYCLICTEYLCVSNLNHSRIHLWMM